MKVIEEPYLLCVILSMMKDLFTSLSYHIATTLQTHRSVILSRLAAMVENKIVTIILENRYHSMSQALKSTVTTAFLHSLAM